MANLPTGTITFLLSDVEGSTRLWEQYPQEMSVALTRHDQIIEQIVDAHQGTVVRPRGEGDSRFAVFELALDAVHAAVEIQRALAGGYSDLPFALKVRMGIHTGAASVRVDDYYGTAVNLCARIRGLGHGGQTLLSKITSAMVLDDLAPGVRLIDLGSVQLKGLSRAENVYQLWIPDLPNDFPPLQAQNIVANNLPAPATQFIGREDEIEQISTLLMRPEVHLVTLTGPGGAGKTRLCLEVGHRLLDQFAHGVFFVDLAPLVDPGLTATTIARSMGIREGGGRPPLENLLDYLADKEMLLILDNFEQIIAGAIIVSQLLAAAPKIKTLVTSRIALDLRGEHENPILSLRSPKSDTHLTPQQLLEYEAVRLFVERAKAIRPAFELNPKNADAVLGICRRLDGLPLAIEIAAARIRILAPEAILTRLDQSLKLLVGGAKDLPSRQQTLRSTIDWSYDLLAEEEKILLARLSVFVGGFTLESAEAVCNAAGDLDILDGVETLIRNNLLRQVDSISDEMRFDMLVTIREYAIEKLSEMGALPELRHSHAAYFGQQSEVLDAMIYGQESPFWLKRIDEEHDNFRAALTYGLTNENALGIAVFISAYLSWFWYRFGHFHEGREWCEQTLAAAEQVGGSLKGLALIGASLMSMWEGDLDIAARRGYESVQIFKALGDDQGLSRTYFGYGVILINQGRDKEAYPNLLTAVELFDQQDISWFTGTILVHMANAALGLGEFAEATARLDQAWPVVNEYKDPWQVAFCLNNYGEVARAQGDYEKAEGYYRRTEELYRQADAASDHARLMYSLAYIALHKEQYEKAKILFHESLNDFRELGNKRGIAECLAGLAGLAAEQGDAAWALPLYSAAQALMTSFGAAWWPADRFEQKHALQLMQANLTEDAFARLWQDGQDMDMEQALACVLGGTAV